MDRQPETTRLVLVAAAVVLGVSLCASTPAFAATYYPTDDAYTTSDAPLSNHGDEDTLKVGRVEPGKQQRTYMRFPLPLGDPCVANAVLSINPITFPNGNQYWFGPLVAGAWDEHSINWSNQPDSVAIAEVPFPWSGGGAITQPVGSAVQYAFDHGIQGRGFVLRSRAPSGVFDQVKFWSIEHGDPTPGYPFLSVTYC